MKPVIPDYEWITNGERVIEKPACVRVFAFLGGKKMKQ